MAQSLDKFLSYLCIIIQVNISMANVNFEENQDDFGLNRSRISGADQDKKYPRTMSRLIQQLFSSDQQKILQMINQLQDEEAMSSFKADLDSLQIRPQISGEKEMRDDFLNRLSQQVQKIFCILFSKIETIGEKNKIFLKSIRCLCKEFKRFKISDLLVQRIWNLLPMATDLSFFIEIMTLMSLFSERNRFGSTRKFGKNKKPDHFAKLHKQCKELIDQHYAGNQVSETKNAEQNKQPSESLLRSLYKKIVKSEIQEIVFDIEIASYLKQSQKNGLDEKIAQKIRKRLNTWMKEYQLNEHDSQKNLELLYNQLNSNLFLHSLLKDILSCEIQISEGKIAFVNKGSKIGEKFSTFNNLKHCLKSKPRNKIQFVDRNSVKVLENCLYCKFDYEILCSILQQIISKDCYHSENILFDLHYLVTLFIDNIDKKVITGNQQETDSTFTYFCKMFEIFIYYTIIIFRSDNISELENCYQEHFVRKFIDQIIALIKKQEYQQSPCLPFLYGNILSFIAYYIHLFPQGDLAYKTFMIKSAMTIINYFNYLPAQWRILKHARFIIQKWAQAVNLEEEVDKVIKIFLKAFFDPEFVYSKDSYFIFIKDKSPHEKYQKIFSRELFQILQQIHKELLAEKNIKEEKTRLKYDRYIFAVHLILLGNFKISQEYENDIAQILFKIYVQFAQNFPSINYLRVWISYYYKPTDISSIVSKIQLTSQALKKLQFLSTNQLTAIECLEPELPQRIPNRQQMSNNFQKFIKEAKNLINLLELKSEIQNLSAEHYSELIHGIINSLSDSVGELYNKILNQMMKSEQCNSEIEKILIRNFFMKKKSVYREAHQIMFSLKNVIRLYLCNLTELTNFQETRIISTEVAKLLQNLHQRDHRQQRTRIQLINQFLSNYTFKKKSNLLCKQTLYSSNIYSLNVEQRKQSLNRSSFLSLNIVVPIFSVLKEMMPHYIKLLTSYGREQFEGRFRFNHHIAFENELRKITQNTDIFEVVIKNTLITHATSLINSIFLPKINNRTDELEKIGLSLYIMQFEQIFNSEECEDYIQDHIATFIQIYKHKNRSDMSRNRQNQRINFKQEEPSNFQKYGILPTTYEEFKVKARAILFQFLKRLPDRIFKMNARKFSLRSLLGVIKQYNETEKQEEKEQKSEFCNEEQFLLLLIEKSKSVLEENLNLRLDNKNEEIIQMQKNEQEKKESKKGKKKSKGIEYSPLCMVFKVLAHIGRDNLSLVKHSFKHGIQDLVTQILEKTTNLPQLSQCFVFLFETLPKFYISMEKTHLQALFKYYWKMLDLLENFRERGIYKIEVLFIKVIQNAKQLRKIDDGLYEDLMKRVSYILNKSLMGSKTIKQITCIVIKLFMSDEKYFQIQAEMEIKGYIYSTYLKQLKQQSKGKTVNKYFGNPDAIAIEVKNYIKDLEHCIIQNEEIFRKLTNEIFSSWTNDGHYLLYTYGIDSLFLSSNINQKQKRPFFEVRCSQNCQYLLKNIANKIVEWQLDEAQLYEEKKKIEDKMSLNKKNSCVQREEMEGDDGKEEKKEEQEKKQDFADEKNLKSIKKKIKRAISCKKKLQDLLQTLIIKFKHLIPYLVQEIKVTNKKIDFLQWILEKSIETLDFSYIDILILCLNHNFLYISARGQQYNSYISSLIITELVPRLKEVKTQEVDKQKKIVYLFMCCLSLKDFNAFSTKQISKKSEQSLETIFRSKIMNLNESYSKALEKNDKNEDPPSQLLYTEGFFIINKHILLSKFEANNRLYEDCQPDQNQFINPKLFFGNQDMSFGRRRMSYHSLSSRYHILEKYKQNLNVDFLYTTQRQLEQESIEAIKESLQKKITLSEKMSANEQIKIPERQSGINSEHLSELYKHFPEQKKKNKKDLVPSSFRYQSNDNFDQNAIESKTLSDYRDLNSYFNSLKKLLKEDQKQVGLQPFLFRRHRLRSDDEEDEDSDFDEDESENKKSPFRIALLTEIEEAGRNEQNRTGMLGRFGRQSDEIIFNPVEFVESLNLLKIESTTSLSPSKKQNEREEQIEEKKQKRKQVESLTQLEQKIDENEINQEEQETILNLIKKQSQTKSEVQEALLIKVQQSSQQQGTERIDKVLQKFKIDEKTLVNQYGITKKQLADQNEEQIAEILAGIIDGKQKEDLKSLHLYENQNYKILASKKNYYQRCNFLFDAPDSFFTDLPLEIRSDIIRERDTLRRDNYRSNRFKEFQNHIFNEENEHNRVSFFTSGNRRMTRRRMNKNIVTKKYPKIPIQSEIRIDSDLIISILKSLLFRIPNLETISNSVHLLLQLETNKINEKVLTTLILMIKKTQLIKICLYSFQKNSHDWEKTILASNSDEIQKFREGILKLIFNSIQNCRFENDKLITNRISFDCFNQLFIGMSEEEARQCFDKELGADESSYLPLNQIFNIVLQRHIRMAPDFMKKAKEVPPKLIDKIFQKTFSGEMPLEFYDNAQILGENQQLANLFKARYSQENPPSFQLLGKIIKYKVGELPYLKKLHEKALKYHVPAHNDFLREIFRYYTKQELLNKSEDWIKHRSTHFKLIEELFDQGKPIQDQPIGRLIDIPDLLDFKTKKMIFLRHPKFQTFNDDDYSEEGTLQIDIDNKDILKSSYNAIMSLVASEMRKRISVKFIGQSAFGEGMFKVWINQVAKEIFSPSACLFVPLGQQDTYQPNPYSYQNPEHLNYFKFLGRLLGVAILQNQVVPAFFTKIFYKTLLNKPAHYSDLKQINPDLYMTIKSIKNSEGEGDIGTVGYTFVYKGLDLQGEKIEKELKPNGKNIIVDEQNKQQFISLATQQVLTDFCSLQYEEIKLGFNDIIPLQTLSIFSVNDLELLISGIPQISIQEFKKYTKYSQYDESDQIIQWFWEVVSESSKEQLTNILQFITGTSRLAEGGFSKNPITIKKANGTDQLPRGVTCFNTLQLPDYSSKQILKDKLTKVIIWSKGGIGLQE